MGRLKLFLAVVFAWVFINGAVEKASVVGNLP